MISLNRPLPILSSVQRKHKQQTTPLSYDREQVTGDWRCDKEHLRPLCARARDLAAAFAATRFAWTPRADNAAADALANRAMDLRRAFSFPGPPDAHPDTAPLAAAAAAAAAGRKRRSEEAAGGDDDEDALAAARARRQRRGGGCAGT